MDLDTVTWFSGRTGFNGFFWTGSDFGFLGLDGFFDGCWIFQKVFLRSSACKKKKLIDTGFLLVFLRIGFNRLLDGLFGLAGLDCDNELSINFWNKNNCDSLMIIEQFCPIFLHQYFLQLS